ncbi:hypothetical protein Ddye_031511 [Dipteronia dyeriana]|uniref:RNase H type-1 domain-containing protein n=1 Tax=Dipteronia dyeriana TaxID=168575 RepID=A0AAD9WME6_9ROSI|nr:hypothetical protein Ddye_031511 [Dipteronia dyeriana]
MLPLVGFYKVNTDAIVIGDQQPIGVGVIIRDANGCIMVSSTHWFATSFSPPVDEASTILKGLQTVISFGYLPVILESDAKCSISLFLLFIELLIWLLMALPNLVNVLRFIKFGMRRSLLV